MPDTKLPKVASRKGLKRRGNAPISPGKPDGETVTKRYEKKFYWLVQS